MIGIAAKSIELLEQTIDSTRNKVRLQNLRSHTNKPNDTKAQQKIKKREKQHKGSWETHIEHLKNKQENEEKRVGWKQEEQPNKPKVGQVDQRIEKLGKDT